MISNILFRLVAIAAFMMWRFYWATSAKKSHTEKPRTKIQFSLLSRFVKYVSKIVYYVILIQLLGLQLLPIQNNNHLIQSIGFVFVVLGITIMLISRKQLGPNWADSHEYQVKTDQTLVTTGIYGYIRHPIYLGVFLLVVGSEMIAESNLYIIFAILVSIMTMRQGMLEEALLTKYFGKKYEAYKGKTKMFIPFVF